MFHNLFIQNRVLQITNPLIINNLIILQILMRTQFLPVPTYLKSLRIKGFRPSCPEKMHGFYYLDKI